MAASLNTAQPIRNWKPPLAAGTALPPIRRMSEKSAQTGLLGTPCQVDVAGASGFVIPCPVISSVATANIAGFTVEVFSNLVASGVAKILNTGQSVVNQSLAVVIPLGAPPNDGTIGFLLAGDEVTFVGILGNSSVAANAIVAQSDLTKIYGLTKDVGNNFWYIDNFITTAATGACVQIIELIDPVGTLNGREGFKVTGAAQQIQL